jgi:hypothetical protein
MRTGALLLIFLIGVGGASAQEAASKGMPPRASAADYQAHAQAGKVTIAAEFTGHGVPTPQLVLSTEDFIGVEVGLFGPAGERLQVSNTDFSLRINGKKLPSPAQLVGAIYKSMKDPEWVSPDAVAVKESKGGLSTGGGGGQSDGPPPPVHVPIALERTWQDYAKRASLPEGERPLPQAGLLFFEYKGKLGTIHSLELIYSGPAGKVTLPLQ